MSNSAWIIFSVSHFLYIGEVYGSQNHPNNPIRNLLSNTAENFEIQILYDPTLLSEEFPITYQIPTTLICSRSTNQFSETLYTENHHSLNIYNGRFHLYRISLVLLEEFIKKPTHPQILADYAINFQILNEAIMRSHLHFRDSNPISRYQIGSKYNREYVKSSRNTFIFLATFLSKKDLNRVKLVNNLYFWDYDGLENFAFILLQDKNHVTYELCALLTGKDASINNTQCEFFKIAGSSITDNFNRISNLSPSRPIWLFKGKFTARSDEHLNFPEIGVSNPFDRNMNLSESWYIARLIVTRSNATLTQVGQGQRLIVFADLNVIEKFQKFV